MSDHCWLGEARHERVKPWFPRCHGRPRVDDRRVISRIVHPPELSGRSGAGLVVTVGASDRNCPQYTALRIKGAES
jgi:hypothetical protein